MADIETEREMSRPEVAAYLHEFADKLGDIPDSATDHEGTTGDGQEGESVVNETENADTNTTDTTDTTDTNTTDTTDTNTTDTTDTTDHEETRREEEGRVTFTLGDESATINPPETIDFDVAVDSTGGMLESGTHETVQFTLAWDAETTDDDGELGLH